MRIPIASIVIGRGRRRAALAKIRELADSIKAIGLRHPITVLEADKDGKYPLVAGRHRLEACRLLGLAEIDVMTMASKIDAEMWEISENLHRADLTVMQRNLSIGQWIKLAGKKLEKELQSRPGGGIESKRADGRGHRKQSGVSAASRELNIAETTARRAVFIADHLSAAAQRELVKLGLENSQRALEYAAKGDGAEQQVYALRDYAQHLERKKKRRRERKQPLASLPPRSFGEAFDRWFHTLDIEMQVQGAIWLLGEEPEKFVEQRKRAAEATAADRKAMH
jgi:ParB-like chromosome segregation protein Spo0J